MIDRRIKVTLVLGQAGLTTEQCGQRLAQIISRVNPSNCALVRLQQLEENKPQLQGLCLCCRMHTELSAQLRGLFMQALQKKREPFSHVIVMARPETDPANILHTLNNDFFLKERFVYEDALCILDAQSSSILVKSEDEIDVLGLRHYQELATQLLAADLIVIDGLHDAVAQEHCLLAIKNYLRQKCEHNPAWVMPYLLTSEGLSLQGYKQYIEQRVKQGVQHRITHRPTRLFT